MEFLDMLALIRLVLPLAALSLSSFAFATTEDSNQTSPEAASQQLHQIEWSIQNDFQDFFPSLVLQTANIPKKSNDNADYIGDPLGQLGIEITTTHPETALTAKFMLDDLILDDTLTYKLQTPGKYRIFPTFAWNYTALSGQKGLSRSNFQVSVLVDGVQERKSIPVRIRSVNDAVLGFKTPNGFVNNQYSFAPYVDENHPAIDQILRKALDLPVPPTDGFYGYQRGTTGVYQQIFSIWYLLQRSGFTYSSITTPSATTENVASQYVRTFDDSVKSRQTNCIDGTVFFASILRKIGIAPLIIVKPGHAYLGFSIDGSNEHLDFLETTLIGNPNVYARSSMEGVKVELARMFKTDLKMQRSWSSFLTALDQGRTTFTGDHIHIKHGEPGYYIVDIEHSRRIGIAPID